MEPLDACLELVHRAPQALAYLPDGVTIQITFKAA